LPYSGKETTVFRGEGGGKTTNVTIWRKTLEGGKVTGFRPSGVDVSLTGLRGERKKSGGGVPSAREHDLRGGSKRLMGAKERKKE